MVAHFFVELYFLGCIINICIKGETGVLENLKPYNVFKYFEELCSIPHGSGNCEAIANYCVEFAKKHNLEYVKDQLNNVIIKKPASKGYENKKGVILQGHLDMVCEKTPESSFNFLKDSLELYIDGDFIRAKNTTLGGDDGIAVAFVLSILEDDSLEHPFIEALFTTDEETGMYGAIGLDGSLLNSNTLINIDMEEEGVLTVGCAGGVRADITIPLTREKHFGDFYKITVSGLKGGHSGVEIDKGRLNSNIILGKILNELENIRLCEIFGGLKDNAIPRTSYAVINTKTDIISLANSFAQKYAVKEDSELDVTIEKCSFSGECFDEKTTANVISFLNQTPNGIIAFSKDIEGLVETSLNLGVLKTNKDNVSFSFAVRSSKESEKQMVLESLQNVTNICNGKINTHSFYPAWEYRENSPLRDTMKKVYIDMYNKEPEITVIHAGLECGILGEKIENLDAVSFGPNVYDVHTTEEHLSISSTKRSYEYLCNILKNL